jgi:hypothetical protein
MHNTITQLIADRLNHASLNDKPEVADALREPRPTFFLITA